METYNDDNINQTDSSHQHSKPHPLSSNIITIIHSFHIVKKVKVRHYFLRLRGPVLYPLLVGFPHGVLEHLPWLPLLLLFPSPPPWGWSTGFIATPLTTGLRPSHRLWPAFLSFLAPCSGFDTVPIVALHRVSINLSLPEGNLTKQYLDAFGSFKIFADVPAARTSFPPWPGFISMLWIRVPIRIIDMGIQLPICELISRVNIGLLFIIIVEGGLLEESNAAFEEVLKLRIGGWRSLLTTVDETIRALESAMFTLL